MLSDIKGIGDVTEKKLRTLGITDERDLVERTPKSYMDMSVIALPQESAEGDFCLFEAELTNLSKPFKKGNLEILKASAVCENTAVKFVWFNRNYAVKILKIGTKYRFYGKLKIEKNNLIFYNPAFEEVGEKTTFCGIQPIYWTRGLIAQKTYRSFVADALKKYTPKSIIGEENERIYGLRPLRDAYSEIHFPEKINVSSARERIATEKIVRRICAFRIAQSKQIKEKTRKYDINTSFDDFFELLPFRLNESQTTALTRIVKAFCSDKKLNAVLCGDVGSGKTAVAVAAAYFVVKNGYRVAVMAPTEILARQHYNFINSIFSRLGINVCFLSGNAKNSEKKDLRFKIKNGFFDVVIGTQALLFCGEKIPNLGFVVEDEQHRFGVAQRTGLISRGEAVDVLTLSATPIPRSMQLVAYGEVEYVTIKRRYEGTVSTKIVPKAKREGMWKYISEQCRKGTQAYVIAPKIYDAEGVESESVEALGEELEKYFDRDKIGVLHGKLKASDKQDILDKFYKNEISVLVSTTVVEVGIDVPNASIMVITDAEKFGLATLHQLRGRVGRNGEKAYCFLYTKKQPTEGLKTLCECSDGFEIAEKDFENRGGGDVFGLEQSGAGTIDGLTLRVLKNAKNIADGLDLSALEPILQKEIESYSLNDVSLT